MFQFRRFPTYAYLIQRRLTEYCSAGFPHSEICGYNAYVQLPTAYRSLSRPSSALDAKAFPLRSSKLDLSARIPRHTGSQELCRPQFGYIAVCVTLLSKKSTNKLCYLSVACLQFPSLFSFQGAVPAFFKARSKCSPVWMNTSIHSRKRSGGPKWTRTTDLTIISRAL